MLKFPANYGFQEIFLKKSLKIPKGQSEAVNRRRTDNTMAKRTDNTMAKRTDNTMAKRTNNTMAKRTYNTMAKRKSTKGQTTIKKTYI